MMAVTTLQFVRNFFATWCSSRKYKWSRLWNIFIHSWTWTFTLSTSVSARKAEAAELMINAHGNYNGNPRGYAYRSTLKEERATIWLCPTRSIILMIPGPGKHSLYIRIRSLPHHVTIVVILLQRGACGSSSCLALVNPSKHHDVYIIIPPECFIPAFTHQG